MLCSLLPDNTFCGVCILYNPARRSERRVSLWISNQAMGCLLVTIYRLRTDAHEETVSVAPRGELLGGTIVVDRERTIEFSGDSKGSVLETNEGLCLALV